MWAIRYQPQAIKALRRMDRATAQRIITKVKTLALDPYGPHHNVKKLKGVEGYRLRVGNWRVVYALGQEALIITVIKIAPRGSVYE